MSTGSSSANVRFLVWLPMLFLFAGCDSRGGDSDVERSYTKSIVREADNAFEAALISQAEAAYPPRDSVLAAVDPQWHEAIPETGYWYHSSFDGVRIPFTLTGDAVDYYGEIIDVLEASEEPQFLTRAELEYHASVSFRETYTFDHPDPFPADTLPPLSFERAYVVEMTLRWYQFCGPLCAMWIDHERIVVFDETGTLLRVFLDGPKPVAVS